MPNTEITQRKKRAMNPKSLANLKPFEKGKSGNSAGPEPGYKHRSTLLREVVDIVSNFNNPITKAKDRALVEKQMEYAIVAKAVEGDVAAYREVKDSLYGKIPVREDVVVNTTNHVSQREMAQRFVIEAMKQGIPLADAVDALKSIEDERIAPAIRTEVAIALLG